MKKHLQKLLLIAALLCVPWVTQGQSLTDYTLTVDTTTFNSIAGTGTPLSFSTLDDGYATATLPFAFGYGENTFLSGTNIAFSANGFIRLNATSTSGTTASYSNTSDLYITALLQQDAHLGRYTNSAAYYKYDATEGTYTIEYHLLGAYTTPYGAYSYQVVLHNNGNIEFIYDSVDLGGATSRTFATYLTDGPNNDRLFITGAWASPVVSTSYTTRPYDTLPAHGLRYTLTRPIVTCPKPATVTASNIAPNSFDFSWTDLSSATSWHVQLLQDSTIVSDNVETTDSVSFTSLLPNTLYTARVAGICGPGDTSSFKTKTVRTACSFITTLPYENGFEDDPYYSAVSYADAFPYCWTRINDASGTINYYPYITTTTSYVHNGTKGMYWYQSTTSTYADNEFAVLPGIDTSVYNISDLTLSFYAKTTSTSYHPQPVVGVMTDPTDASTFTPVHTLSSTDITTTWQLFAIPLANFTGYGNYIAIKWARPSSSCYMAIDDIFVTNEWCNPPQNVTATSTLEEVTISWTGSDDYSYRVILNDDTVTGITDHFYTFANLTPNTQYEYSVATECASSTSLNLSGSIRTRCYLLDSVPYTMGFEASEGVNTGSTTNNDFVNCWFHLNNGTNYFGYPYVASSSSYNHTPGGSRGLYWYLTTTTGTYGDYQIVVLPGVDTNIYPTTTLQLSFWARASSASYYPTFTVGVMTDPNDINTFVLVDTVNIGNSTAWNEYTTSLASYNGSGNYVALRADRPTSSWYAYVDDITLEMIPDCPHVENIAAHSITTNSAELSWHETGSATNWEITYLSDGTPSDLAVTMTVTDTNATLTGLQPNTHYYVWITPICPGYVRPQFISFRTNCNFLDSLPYSMSFESWEGVSTGSSSNPNFANCWHRLNNGTSYFGYPYVNSSGNYNHTPNGVQGLYWYNSTTLNTYGDYQVVVLPAVDIYQYPLRTLQLSFWARSTSTSYYPVFTVGVMSDPNDINTFVAVDTIHVDNSTAWGEYITSLESYSGNGTFVALRADRTSAYWYACVDDITLSVRSCGLHANRLPYFDNFDNYTVSTTAKTGVEPPCWTLVHQDVAMTDEYKPMLYYNPDNAHSGDYSLLLNKRGIYAMPYIDTNINNLKLSFYLKQQQTKYQLQVGVMSDLNDPNTFEPFTTIDNSSTNVEFVKVDFSSYTGNGHYIAFHNILAPGYNGDFSCNYIDDLTLYSCPANTTYSIMSMNTYTWHDSTYTESGIYLFTYENENGCSITDTLQLTICPQGVHNIVNAIDYYEWHGQTFYENGWYNYVYSNDEGCYITDTLQLYLWPCYTHLTDSEGTFSYGPENPDVDCHVENINCAWLIQPEGATIVELSITKIHEDWGDHIIIYDGDNPDAPVIAYLYDRDLPWDSPRTIISTGNSILVQIENDDNCTGSKWTAHYKGRDCYCPSQYILTDVDGGFNDNPVNDYANNSNCSWLIRPREFNGAYPDSITLTFTNFNTEEGYDIVTVYDGDSTDAPVLATLSGSIDSFSVTSSDSVMLVVFTTNDSITASGWEASYYSHVNLDFYVYSDNEEMGTVTGSGSHPRDTEFTIEAFPNDGYVFLQWSDGSTENPRTIWSSNFWDNYEFWAYFHAIRETDVPDNVPTDGLMAYYPFTANADDYSGNNNHGLREGSDGGPSITTDRFGNDSSAYEFGGYDRATWIRVKNSNSLQLDTSLTISVWVIQYFGNSMDGWGRRQDNRGGNILCKDGDRGGFWFSMGDNTEHGYPDRAYVNFGNKYNYQEIYSYMDCQTTPKWAHYVAIADGRHLSIYCNGVLAADTINEQSISFHDANGRDLMIGIYDMGSPFWYPFNGKIDDIALYNRALSEEEIQLLYGGYVDPAEELCISDTIDAFGSIVWHGNTYSESGDYVLRTANGCDTIYRLHLIIHDNCTIQSLPFFDDFDHYTTSTTAKTGVRPSCWTLARQDVAIADEYKPMIYYNADNTHSGDYSLILNKRGIFAMPYLDANINDVKISFYLRQQQAKYQLQVGVMSDLWDFSTYVPVTTINNSSTNIEFVQVDFSSYTGNGHYIAFRNILASGYNGDYSINYIDDLTLYTCPDGSYYDTLALGSYTWHDSTYSASGLYTYNYVDRYGCPITDTLHLTVCPTLSGTAHYSDASVFVQGLNVPHDMLFDTLGNMYVVNHGFNGAYDSLRFTITRIDTSGNIHIVGTNLVYASGMVIDKEQSLYVNQGNGSWNITKIPYGGSQYVWTNLDIQSNTLALFDDGNPDHFRLYAAASWGGGLRVIDHDGNYSSFGNFNRAYILGLSEDGEYLYFDTWNDDEETSTIYRYSYSEDTFTPMSGSIFRGVGEWGGIGPDNKCYFTAYSLSNPDYKALYRIDGIESFTEIISDLPDSSEIRAPLWKQNGNTYDLYLGEVVNSNRPNPDDNRIIKFTSLGNYYDWKDTMNVTVCGETEYTWPVNGMTYTENGSYYYHTQTPDGCDSMVILNLFFGGSDTSETIVSEKHFTWHDSTYTESGIYTFSHENEYGCPVTDTLFLTIYNCPKGISDTITATDSYTWHNQSYTESGIYTFLGYVYYEDSIYQVNDIPADAVYYCPIIDTLYLTICNIRIADLPYTDDFDSSTSSTTAKTGVEPNCWTLVHQDVTMSDEYKPMIYYNSDNAHSGDYSLLLNKRGIYAMPIIDTNISDIKLSFYLRQQQTKYRLQVGVIDNLEDPNTFVPVTTIDNSSTDVEYVEVDFSSYTGDGHYIAFRNILAPGYNGDFSCNYIDDLTLSVNYTVTTEVYPANGGMVTGGGIYPAGYTCTMTATAADGYNFLYWTDGSNIVSNQDVYNFTVSSNITLTAVFYVIGSQNHYCPGLKNPMSFTSGATSGAYVGYYSGQTGQKQRQAPNALTGATGVSMFSGIIPANQLANTTGNGGTSYCGNTLDPTKRFRIMSNTDGPGTVLQAGKDPLVNYNLSYCPTAFDPTITKSIRLGNCGYNAEAEALYYTIEVKPLNALLFIYYALVVQSPGHGIEGDPSFVVRVTRRNASNQWQQISDTLFYTVSSYNISDGIDGWHRDGHGYVYYHDWDKINIDLSKYLYEQVRIEFYMSDCSASGHYGYCYIAGDCQPMEISIDGCHSGNTQEVATLSAPAGLTNYVWYKCNADGQFISSPYFIPDTVAFTQLTPDSNTNNTYTCTLDDFMVTDGENAGQLTNNMVFRCDITSALDPDKPIVTTHYARVINTKPVMAIDSIQSCGGNITLINRSYVPHKTDGCDTAATQWWFYHNGRVDTATGASTSYQFDNSGVYNIKVRSFSRDDHSCYADSTYTVNIIHNTGTFTSVTVNTTTPYTWHGQTYDATGTYTYDYVDSNGCPSTDTLHLTVGSDCGIQVSDLPYTDNFDHYTASTTAKTGVEPDCWTLAHQDVAMTDEYKPMIYYNASTAHSGNYSLILNKRGIYAMPAFEGDVRSLQLQFYLKQTQTKYQLLVGVMSDLNDYNTFVPVATFNNTSTTASVLRTVDFASYTGDGHYIAFRNILASGYTGDYSCNYIDDITLTANSPVCSIGLSDLPYTDNFDHYTTSTTAKTGVEPPCWTLAYQNVSMTDEYKPMIYYSASNAHSGRYSLILNKRGIYAMPEFEGNVNTLQLSFYLKQTQAKYQLQVGVMSDLSDPSSFIPVATINNSSTTASVLNTVNFSSYTGNGHYIVFKNILASGYTGEFSCNYIDDLVLEIRQDPCVLGVSDLPYTDNFDSYTSSTTAKTGIEPPCWTLAYQNVSMTDEYKPMIYYSASNAHSGRYSLILNKRGIYAMPEFEGNVNTLQLSFYLKQTQAKYQLQVGVMSDLSDPSSFIPVATINNSSTTASVLNTVNFSSYTGNGHYIVFKNILAPGNTGDYSCNYIDDLTLSVAGAKNTFDDDSYTDNRHRLALYPNPTTGIITVEADEEVVRVEVFDYTGRNVAVFESQTTLDLSRLAAGIYTLRITLPERIEVRRVVKQ